MFLRSPRTAVNENRVSSMICRTGKFADRLRASTEEAPVEGGEIDAALVGVHGLRAEKTAFDMIPGADESKVRLDDGGGRIVRVVIFGLLGGLDRTAG